MFKWIKQKILIWRVNKCLDIKLRKEQIDYIFNSNVCTIGRRCTRKTLTQILRILLNTGFYDFKNLSPNEKRNVRYALVNFNYFKKIYYKLKEKNLVQCTIINIEARV